MLHNKQDLAIQELKEQIGELMQKIDAKELMQKIEAKDRDLAIQLLTEQIGELCQKIDAKEFDQQLGQSKLAGIGELMQKIDAKELGQELDQSNLISKLAAMETKFDNFGIKLCLIGRQLDQDLTQEMAVSSWRQEQGQTIFDLVDLVDSTNAKINAQTQVTLSVADKFDDIHILLDDIKRGQERTADDLQKCVSQLFDENDDMRRWNDGEANDMRAKIDVLICLVSGNPQTQT